mmetsp:Transcript_22748/g.53080  ORF Transcript_22748/g.53080 Transcript_22748/m.53080 type:complete len:263 (+) Transcript_22748:108-896(+)
MSGGTALDEVPTVLAGSTYDDCGGTHFEPASAETVFHTVVGRPSPSRRRVEEDEEDDCASEATEYEEAGEQELVGEAGQGRAATTQGMLAAARPLERDQADRRRRRAHGSDGLDGTAPNMPSTLRGPLMEDLGTNDVLGSSSSSQRAAEADDAAITQVEALQCPSDTVLYTSPGKATEVKTASHVSTYPDSLPPAPAPFSLSTKTHPAAASRAFAPASPCQGVSVRFNMAATVQISAEQENSSRSSHEAFERGQVQSHIVSS